MSEVNQQLCEEKHKTIDKRLDCHDERMQKIEEGNIKLTAIVEILTSPEYNKNFWETDTGKKLIAYFMVIGLAVIGAAIGINLFEYFK